MKTRGQADRGPYGLTEGQPDTGSELGASVRNNVHGQNMEPEDVSHQVVSSFHGRW